MLNAMVGLLVGSEQAYDLRPSARARVGPQERRVRPCRRHRGRPHVLDEDLFRGALVRERRRADRFGQPFALIRIAARSEDGKHRSGLWTNVFQALGAVRSETAVLGWIERGTQLGLILPDVPPGEPSPDMEKRLRRELVRRVGADALAELSISKQAYGSSNVSDPLQDLRPQPQPPGEAFRRALKRALDVAGSSALLLFLAPLFVLLAILVKLTSAGPVFFRQPRVGERTRPFTMLKFRTMHVNADAAIHQQFVSDFITAGGSAPQSARDGVFKIVNDPRVTSIGHFLRRTSLDELPQLWNVYRGDMSLVGPRPPLAYEVEQYKPWHRRRVLEAKPGITGLWQVKGRSRTTFDDMVRLDLRYARSCSVWMDIKILLATPRAVISGKGAC